MVLQTAGHQGFLLSRIITQCRMLRMKAQIAVYTVLTGNPAYKIFHQGRSATTLSGRPSTSAITCSAQRSRA